MNNLQRRLIVRLFPLLLVFVCSASIFQAQDEGETQKYRLVEPSAADYIENIEPIIANAITTNFEDYSFWEHARNAELDALTDEIKWRLFDQQHISYEQLLTLYRAYAVDARSSSNSGDDAWLSLLIEAYLTEHEIELYGTSVLAFDGFVFDVKAWQIQRAYSLTLRAAPDWAEPRYLLIDGGEAFIVIDDESGTYRLPPLPFAMTGGLVDGGDFNADGQPDFAYIHYTHWGHSYISGDLHVVTWTGETMETLATVDFRHGPHDGVERSPVIWQFIGLDNDAEQELMQSLILYDNWRCMVIRMSYYDWQDDATLNNDGGGDAFPQSFNCLLRRADEASWKQNYAEAVSLYEGALEQPDQDADLIPYTQMRLGLAYLFNGQNDEARQMLSTLSPVEDNEQTKWANAVRESYLRDPRLLAVCQAIYDQATEIHDPSGITGAVYVTDGGFYGPDSYRPNTSLTGLSCDLRRVLAQHLSVTEFFTAQTPTAQLEALGLVVGDSITADFDVDGEDEWIVWIDSLGLDPLLFVPDETHYSLTVLEGLGYGDIYNPVPDLRLSDPDNQYWVTRLPDGTQALVNVDFSHDDYAAWICGGMCGGGPSLHCIEHDTNRPRSIGDVGFWRLEDGRLKAFFFSPACKWLTPEQLFPGGEGSSELHAYEIFPVGEWDDEARPSVYFWDENRRTFVAPPQPTWQPPTPESTPVSTPVPRPEYDISIYTLRRIRTTFAEHNFTNALEMLDISLAQESQNQGLIMAFRYYRGLTLEALNRPDEALADYITIYETDPESAWGLMAGLHLQIKD